MIRAKKYNFADLIGIVSASICLVHCLATPLLIVFGAAFITNPAFKYLFLIISFAYPQMHNHFKSNIVL